MRGVPNALGPSLTLGLLGPSHQWCHKSQASLWGPVCAHGVVGTPQGEVRDSSPPSASICKSHPDVEIVSSAPSQPVVPVVELSSDDEMDKPHESDDDDEEESTPFVQMETKPLKLLSGAVIKVKKDQWRLEEEKRARRIARRAAWEAKEKELTNAVATSQAEVTEMNRRQAETDRK